MLQSKVCLFPAITLLVWGASGKAQVDKLKLSLVLWLGSAKNNALPVYTDVPIMGNESQGAVGMPDGVQDSHGLLML